MFYIPCISHCISLYLIVFPIVSHCISHCIFLLYLIVFPIVFPIVYPVIYPPYTLSSTPPYTLSSNTTTYCIHTTYYCIICIIPKREMSRITGNRSQKYIPYKPYFTPSSILYNPHCIIPIVFPIVFNCDHHCI